jgi:hypothetical protein
VGNRGEAPVTRWDDHEWWRSQIDMAIAGGDPALCNLRITLAHQELSLALRRITGENAGANFHTWAVWGSKKAGRTIRNEDVPLLSRPAIGSAALVCAGAAAGLARGGPRRRAATSLAAGASSALVLMRLRARLLGRAAGQIFAGNVTVLDDIGRQTARFVSAFLDPAARTEERLSGFLAALRPGASSGGGQDLLRGAYAHYFDAARERDHDRRDELMLCANLFAILHEHYRLEPYIDGSVPRPLRRFVTEYLLSFTVGSEAMSVSLDVPSSGRRSFSDTLATIELPELEGFLCDWDRTPDSLIGSGARDWTKLSDRMNFIVDLFRTRQSDSELFTSPFSPPQREMIVSGRMPPGPL